jgi:hypothetical protein
VHLVERVPYGVLASPRFSQSGLNSRRNRQSLLDRRNTLVSVMHPNSRSCSTPPRSTMNANVHRGERPTQPRRSDGCSLQGTNWKQKRCYLGITIYASLPFRRTAPWRTNLETDLCGWTPQVCWLFRLFAVRPLARAPTFVQLSLQRAPAPPVLWWLLG